MKNIQVIFDFDGVILNSHKIKTKAFYKIFEPFGKDIAIKTSKYHLKNIGISRFKKFDFIIENILKDKKISRNFLNKRFNSYCNKKIEMLNVSKNLINFFKKNSSSYELYVSTATPKKTISNILKKKKLSKYFKKIYGSPDNKIQHINKIKKNNFTRVFIGDTLEDYISSVKTNTKFILKEHNENKNKLKNLKVHRVKNFKNLEKNIRIVLE
jgi:phosphoglycolate phosphatase-like HAD superfamily hydrolase